jgi:hypothetical protein
MFGHRQADKSKDLLTPLAEQAFQSFDIDTFKYAMKSGLTGRTAAFETEPVEPMMRVVAAPIRDGCLRGAAAHHRDAAKQKNRKKVIALTFSLSEIGKK